jgi:protein disulfide-isomerase A1
MVSEKTIISRSTCCSMHEHDQTNVDVKTKNQKKQEKMIRSLLAALAAMAMMVMVNAEEAVMTLTDANLADTIANNQFVLVEFYAPWCGHCKSLAPEYEKAAQSLKKDDATSKIILGKVDATAETKAAEQYQVQGFPTLKWFVNGVATEYGGGRTADTIVSWIKKKTGPATTKLTSVADVEKLKGDADVVVILVADEESKAFEAAAQTQEIPFGVALKPSAEVLKALGVESTGQLVVFKKFDEGRAQIAAPADITSEQIVTFVSGHLLPLIVPFSQETAQKIFGGSVRQHFILFVDKADEAQTAEVKKQAQPVAEEMRGKYLFVTVDKTDERVTEFFGITAKDLPTGRVVQLMDNGMKKYRIIGDKVTTESIRETCEKHSAGTLSPDLKSEPVPEKDEGDVKVLVGKNFNDVIKTPGKDVFVEFYAPWCGHCKSLAPKWEELGKWAKDKPNLIIAKMDATANDVEAVQISGFPTLKLFKADSDEIVDYEDARELENMIAFLEKNAASCSAA